MVSTRTTALDSVLPPGVLSFFGVLPDGGRKRIVDSLVVHDLSAGEVLFWHGHAGGSVSFVVSGELSLWWEAADGEQELLRFAGGGDLITPAAMLDRTPRQRSCLAEGPTRVYELSSDGFCQLTARDPVTAGHVLEMVSACALEHPDSSDPSLERGWLDSELDLYS